ncbi:hypothetical protein ABFS82_14G131500 [Erythranthe guttata]|uniref:uncharacterized protein LOC105974159 n=1 Tax=Erythranthe guttata TaxID=4155 RepID=UPI00064DDC3C|nr:PREDICTED: uncharacterized protein LOC105974159 [Erythranthe guttata]|eukprot:XP_012854684.1 PREDICTED: uncharacterized protein LOC105974159 [Erythranthe guttata]
MEFVLRFPQVNVIPRMPWLSHSSKTKKNRIFNTMEDDNRHTQSAMERASLRYRETLRPDPVLTDPYIRCLVPTDIQMDVNLDLQKHCLATKFIDDKLLSTIDKIDGLRQVVLLTDGMDTRPYRINWPSSTIIFDVSPDITFRRSIQSLQDVGAKIRRSCLLLHVPSETSDIEQVLCSKGYNGARPSFWVFQGLPLHTLGNFKDILRLASNLAMKGSLFVGELPSSFFETDKSTKMEWMDKIFTSHGLKVKMIEYDEVARNLGKQESIPHCQENVLFVAEQLQFSDVQMEIWRREFERIEEGDEEGFEEL